MLWLLIGVSAVMVLGVLFYRFVDSKSKLIKSNQTGYKVSGSGVDKLYSIMFNPFARQMIWLNWQLKCGLIKPLSVGSLAKDVSLVHLDGTSCSLIKDFVRNCPTDMPLVVNIGSYN